MWNVHSQLDVFVNGKRVVVAAGIGINIKDPGVKTFRDTPDGSKAYGGIEGCDEPCISPLHTHDNTGIVCLARLVLHRPGDIIAIGRGERYRLSHSNREGHGR